MNLESVIQGEVSQKEKNIYINEYTWKIEKWNWWTYLQGRKRDADIENTVGEGEGGMNWESSMETYITTCKTDS